MSKEGQAPTILVVEDSPDIRELLGFLLEKSGYRVIEAADGNEAIETARRECPDIVLMDLGLPVLDGVSSMRAIRQIEALCDVPIIVISGFDSTQKEAALAAGCNAFLSKPIDTERLLSVIRQHLVMNH